MTFALIGNQNCGKTTLFNQLTGSNQHVGNFPGVTVEKKEGKIKHHKAEVIDLPGIYSLSPYTSEEVVTRDFLLKEHPDAIINIVDSTNIERNLYLTLQLMELNIPMILALNMIDELRVSGSSIDVEKLSDELGIPALPISASKNEGIDELVEICIKTAKEKQCPKRVDFCKGEVHKAIHSIAHIIEDHAARENIPTRFAATKMVEQDALMIKKLGLHDADLDIIHHIIDDMEKNLDTDAHAALADMRYEFIEYLTSVSVKKKGRTKQQILSEKIDKVLTHKIFAIPIFIGIMLLVFYLTFGLIGGNFSKLFSIGIDYITNTTDKFLTNIGLAAPIHSLIIDGVFAGVGSVLSFLPTIITLFFLLSLLEDSGYMARVAFVMDKLLRKIGLSGRSFVPMLIGFGCSVPAFMATRTLSSEKDRKMTIFLIPFMSCSAKLPIYTLFTSVFFPDHAVIVMASLYIGGIILGILTALLFKHTLFKGKPIPFIMELPAYRFPAPENVLLHMWEKAKDFLKKAFTIIFIATIIIWFLQNFDLSFHMVQDNSQSILASIGKFIAPIFKPLGFGNWQSSAALITGLSAKEAVVSTLAVITKSGTITSIFTPASALSFLTFTLLYMPCIAAMSVMKKELNSKLGMLFSIFYQTGIAYIASFAVYNIIKVFI